MGHFLSSCFEMFTLLVELYLDTIQGSRTSENSCTGSLLHKGYPAERVNLPKGRIHLTNL